MCMSLCVRLCGCTPGRYMYVDSAYTQTFQEVAQLVSPLTTEPLSGCLSFSYQQQQAEGHWLSFYTRDQAGQYQELWRAPEPADQQQQQQLTQVWIPVQVDMKAPNPVQVSPTRAGRPYSCRETHWPAVKSDQI